MKTRPTVRIGAKLLGTALTALTLTIAPASAQPASRFGKATPMTMQHDLATRAKAIQWPEGFDPQKADLFSHNSLLVHAICDKVWSHIVDAGKRPQWYPTPRTWPC
jgi:hypothetical protein